MYGSRSVLRRPNEDHKHSIMLDFWSSSKFEWNTTLAKVLNSSNEKKTLAPSVRFTLLKLHY